MAEHFYATDHSKMAGLLALGFTPIEATRLMHMKDHVSEQSEYRENIAERRRLEFIRWLIANNRMSI